MILLDKILQVLHIVVCLTTFITVILLMLGGKITITISRK